MDQAQAENLLRRMVDNQAISVRSWLKAFEEHRDLSSVRNATESLARWYGMYKSYRALFGENGMPHKMEEDFEHFHLAREVIQQWQPQR